jgi:lipopolysaccharide export system protein LptA
MREPIAFSLAMLAIALGSAVPGYANDATITSDEMQILDGGAKTIFNRHVVLKQDTYVIRADRMTRIKDTGIVDALGQVEGTWTSEKGEIMTARGKKARYTPSVKTLELWVDADVTRWETAQDTAPVIIQADRFIALQAERVVWAKENVRIRQTDRLKIRCDEAKFDEHERKLYLWGHPRMDIHVKDQRGEGDFQGDQGWVTLSPKRAQLTGEVKGRVNPAPR